MTRPGAKDYKAKESFVRRAVRNSGGRDGTVPAAVQAEIESAVEKKPERPKRGLRWRPSLRIDSEIDREKLAQVERGDLAAGEGTGMLLILILLAVSLIVVLCFL